MNARTAVLIFAVVLIGLGLIMTISSLFESDPEPPRMVVARAAQQIEPYTPIEQGMLEVEDMTAREATDLNAWRAEQVVGMMATDLIKQGEVFSAGNALPVEDYRGCEDLNMELVSFSASVDRLVAGTIRSGQLINIYGISREGGSDEAYTILLEPNVRVCQVFAGGANEAGRGTAVPDLETGRPEFSEQRPRATSLLTVQLPPEKAYGLIDALGARGLQPYVTLAGSRTVPELATPPARAQAEVQPTQPAIDIGATMTAIWEQLQQTPVAPPVTGGGGNSR